MAIMNCGDIPAISLFCRPEQRALESSIRENLAVRLDGFNYTQAEIEQVANLDRALFPAGFVLEKDKCEELRVLARLSRCELKHSHMITSHRKVLGPFIVAGKRLLWRIVRANLENHFSALEEFCSQLVESHARLIYEVEALKKRSPAK